MIASVRWGALIAGRANDAVKAVCGDLEAEVVGGSVFHQLECLCMGPRGKMWMSVSANLMFVPKRVVPHTQVGTLTLK